MAEAPTLFDYAATRGASRATDPQTSRDAARSLEGHPLRDQQALVLAQVGVFSGSTAWDIACVLARIGKPVQQNVVAKRLGELRDLGMVRLNGKTRPGSSSRMLQVYVLTEQGSRVAS